MAETHEDILTPAEVAQVLRTSREHVRQLCIAGRLPYIDVGTGSRSQYRIRRDDLESFKRSQRRRSANLRYEKDRAFTGAHEYV